MRSFAVSKCAQRLRQCCLPHCTWSYFSPALFMVAMLPSASVSAEIFFNPSFLSGDPTAIADLSRFEKDEGQAAGQYHVELYLNDDYVATRNINFVPVDKDAPAHDDSGLLPCLSYNQLSALNVNMTMQSKLTVLKPEQCLPLPEVIEGAQSEFDFEKQRLKISIPQVMLVNNVRGYIPPDQWDNGITAALLTYNFSGGNSWGASTNNSYFLNLNSGFNWGAWRLRDNSSWSYSSGAGQHANQWQHINTYLQRAIIPLKGELTLGDHISPNDVFDSVNFRGVQLASDDNMLPDSLRGFAPTVHGVAKSHAKVTINQNGYVIYQTYVSPGAFAISDLYPTSSSGDLKVEVQESDGSISRFTVPYSAVPVLQREGRVKYAATAGQYRSGDGNKGKPGFAQGTLIWGLPAGVTLYGGSQLSNDYAAFAFGAGKNLGSWGAMSADVTQANSRLADDSRHQGQSLRFLYAKSLNEAGTNFQLLGYRYSTEGFYTLDDTSYRRMSGYSLNTQDGPVDVKPTANQYYNLKYSKKGRVQVNITQQVWDYGSLFLTGSRQTYWHTDEKNDLLQAGYSAYWNDISYSLSYSHNKSPGLAEADKRVALNLSLPLGKWLSGGGAASDITRSSSTAYATYAANTDTHGQLAQQAGVSGSLLAGKNLTYGVMQGYSNRGGGGNGSANLNYQGTYGNSNLSYSYSSGYRQVNYGLSGGITAHANGVTLSQPLSDTNVLVAAAGAKAVAVENATGVSTDWRGYAVMPYATTYRLNRVALDPTTLQDNADLDDAVVNVIPTKGALVRAEFAARIGARALMMLQQRNGKAVPFGATVAQENGSGASIVGENGQVYLSGLPLSGKLQVAWGHGAAERCEVSYQLPQGSEHQAINYAKAGCQ
ncbi:TPA: fimbrial biogenesis usher protein [Serratia odorifera]|jgi:outer membrane usher protein|uniref:fimbrial biogenesis usher protein n=1 Tax=Serratia odorifera TaxID=618 RepID=UPI0018E775A1|nr:fimbrial biogenesis usher protein [Serratia odorifera]MBJ2067212.1 fimbrial biogenesis usher protein [Serratia odorifera]